MPEPLIWAYQNAFGKVRVMQDRAFQKLPHSQRLDILDSMLTEIREIRAETYAERRHTEDYWQTAKLAEIKVRPDEAAPA